MFVHRSYAASVVEQQARQHSEQVQAAIVTLRTAHRSRKTSAATCVATDEGAARRRAELTSCAERQPDSPRAYSVPLIDGERLRVDQRLGGEQWDDRDRDTLLTLAGSPATCCARPN